MAEVVVKCCASGSVLYEVATNEGLAEQGAGETPVSSESLFLL